jgi:hypothetical protein
MFPQMHPASAYQLAPACEAHAQKARTSVDFRCVCVQLCLCDCEHAYTWWCLCNTRACFSLAFAEMLGHDLWPSVSLILQFSRWAEFPALWIAREKAGLAGFLVLSETMFSVCKSLRLFSISVASPYQWSFQKTYKIQQDYRATWELECFPFWQRKCIYFQIYTVKMSCHLGFYIKWGRKIFKITQIPPELFFGPLTTHTCRCEHRHTSTNVYACVHMYTCSHKRTCMHVYNQTPANTHTHTHTLLPTGSNNVFGNNTQWSHPQR